jgi:hypothetical protein
MPCVGAHEAAPMPPTLLCRGGACGCAVRVPAVQSMPRGCRPDCRIVEAAPRAIRCAVQAGLAVLDAVPPMQGGGRRHGP